MELDCIKDLAKELMDGTDNVEYCRGVCELISDMDGKEGVDHPTRALQIARELGVSPEVRQGFYHCPESIASMLQDLRVMVDLEYEGVSVDRDRYIWLYDVLSVMDVEIPFGVEI